jgi:hypothetical protein
MGESEFGQVEADLAPASYVVLAVIAGLKVWRGVTHKTVMSV